MSGRRVLKKQELTELLSAEVEAWSRKSYEQLIEDLPDVIAFEREEPEPHQFEVQLLETTPEYVHVMISIDDGSFWRSFAPITRTFIVHRSGEIEAR